MNLQSVTFYKYKKSLEDYWKIFQTLLLTRIAPLFLACMSWYFIFYEEDGAWSLLLAVPLTVYLLFAFYATYRSMKAPTPVSFTFDANGVSIFYNGNLHEVCAKWSDIECISYFNGEIVEGLNSTTEYKAYTDINASFICNGRDRAFFTIRILNDDYWCEEDKTVFDVIMMYNPDKDKLRLK